MYIVTLVLQLVLYSSLQWLLSWLMYSVFPFPIDANITVSSISQCADGVVNVLYTIATLNPLFTVPANLTNRRLTWYRMPSQLQYIPRNMHTVFALLCFVVVIHWLIFPYPSGLLHWHCGNLTIAPVPAKQPWWIWINTTCEFIMNDSITTTKQSTTKPCAYFLGYTVWFAAGVDGALLV